MHQSGRFDGAQDLVAVDRLDQQVASAEPDGLDGVLHVGMSAHENDLGASLPRQLVELLCEMQPVQFGHPQVREHDGRAQTLCNSDRKSVV